MGEEKGVVIDIERERQTAGGKGTGEKVEMSQQRFARVEPRQWHDAAVVINDLDEMKSWVILTKPAMG